MKKLNHSSNQYSYRLGFINFIMTIMIVLLHSFVKPSEITHEPFWYSDLWNYCSDIFSFAVPTFWGISTFLLFRNYDLKDYKKKVVSRFWSLIVPYFIFSFVLYILNNSSFAS